MRTLRTEYYFVPLYKWNRTNNIKPTIEDYAKFSKWDIKKPTNFAIVNDKLFAYGKTYGLKSNKYGQPFGKLFDNSTNCNVFFGSNSMAGEEWHVYDNGWATFNIMGSGVPVIDSYLGQYKPIPYINHNG